MKVIVYTALFADSNIPLENVGKFFPFEHPKDNVEYIAFTNRKDLKSEYWDVRYVELKESSPRVDARFYKLNSHLVLPEHDFSIWMDSQCYFRYKPTDIITLLLDQTNAEVAIHHHSDINSLAQESVAQAWVYKNDNSQIIMNQMIKYEKDGFPMNGYDHFETGILIRRNNNNVKYFNELWWDEVTNNSLRDQLSIPFVVWKCRQRGMHIYTIPESFTAHKHRLPIPKSKIFFTTPKPPLREDISKR